MIEEDEYMKEEIDPLEVETFVAVLHELMERAQSESIRVILEEACEVIASLVEEEDETAETA